jgi:hypothetical protein
LDDSPKTKTLAPPKHFRELLHFLVGRLLAAGVAKLLGFQPLGMLLLILCRRVVAVLTIPALQCNNLAHSVKSLSVLPENFG